MLAPIKFAVALATMYKKTMPRDQLLDTLRARVGGHTPHSAIRNALLKLAWRMEECRNNYAN